MSGKIAGEGGKDLLPVPLLKVPKRKTLVPMDWGRVFIPPTAIMCPYCNCKSHFTPIVRTGRDQLAWVIQRCDNCFELVLTRYRLDDSHKVSSKEPEAVYPYARPVVDPSVPSEVARDYVEAFTCYSAGAFNASVAMSRRAIQTAAIKRGASPNKNLYEQINELGGKGIEKSLIELANAIRLLGNVPASHPSEDDLTRSVQPEECKQILDFLEAFIDSVFIRPAKIERMRKTREASKKETEKKEASES